LLVGVKEEHKQQSFFGKGGSVSENEPGAMEKAKGMAKEAAGKVMGDEEMKAEGRVEREGGTTEGHQEYYRSVVRESMERSGLS
jgi:uncharacterized protein YjbJ (UPF0337 family)